MILKSLIVSILKSVRGSNSFWTEEEQVFSEWSLKGSDDGAL
jgi:hypothetical protein